MDRAWLPPAILLVVFGTPTACMQADRRLAVRGSGADGGSGATFGTPSMVTGLRTETDVLQDPTLGADELEIYFMSVTGSDRDIWRSQRAAATDPWASASLVVELSTTAQEEDPELAPDGLSLYFSSDRSEGAGVMRLFFSRRAVRGQAWGAPQQILGLGTSSADVAPTVDSSGLTLVFASMRDGADFHLYASSRPDPAAAWGLAEELVAVNSDWQDRDPALYDHGSALVLCSRRTGQGRTSDLFQITRSDPAAAFAGVPAAITELNSDAWEGDPWMSEGGRHIVFVSDRTGTPRIYEAWR